MPFTGDWDKLRDMKPTFMCCLCFSAVPLEYATWDMHDSGPPSQVDVCIECRIPETYWMIRKHAGYTS